MTTTFQSKHLSDQEILHRSQCSGQSIQQEVAHALERGEGLLRYLRNAETLSLKNQACLALARVLIVGCGGLGGQVLEHLVRVGVGTIFICDPNVFDTTHANRQLLATCHNTGRLKVDAACERATEVNPLVSVWPMAEEFSKRMVQGMNAVVDCLGCTEQRKDLQIMTGEEGVPLVSARVAGWNVVVSTIWPNETGLAEFGDISQRQNELMRGTPSPVAGFAASLQAIELIRLLIGGPSVLRGNLLMADLAGMRFSTVSLQTGAA